MGKVQFQWEGIEHASVTLIASMMKLNYTMAVLGCGLMLVFWYDSTTLCKKAI